MQRSLQMSEETQSSKPVPSSSRRATPVAAPVVVRKKKNVKRSSVVEKPQARPNDPPSELLVPLVLIGVGLAANVVTTMMLRPDSMPLVMWVAVRMVIVVASTVLTYGALFIAAQVVEADYGYISTGAVKVAAITLTQSWVGDLATEIPIPYVPALIAFLATYAMFKYFFDLDDRDAIASMLVVRLVHWIAVAVVFIAIIAAISGGKESGIIAPLDALAPADNGAAVDDDDPPDDDPADVNGMDG